MSETFLTQSEADALIAMPKQKINDDKWVYPGIGGYLQIPLISQDRRENFLLDIRRGSIAVRKGTYQTRTRKTIVLLRLDLGGSPHRNPDGENLPCPHLHIYREGFGDKWAIEIPSDVFSDVSDLWQAFQDFMRFSNVVEPPIIVRGLFV